MVQTAAKKTAKQKVKRDIYQEATDKIIKMLERGVAPWRCTWSKYGMARNYKTGHQYTGINALMMNFTEHPIPLFLSYKQAKELGGNVKRGAKSEQVYYYNVYYRDEHGNTLAEETAKTMEKAGLAIDTRSYIKYYNVFNIEDVEGIEIDIPEVKLKDNEKIEKCESIISNMVKPPRLKTLDANQPFYSATDDILNMPDIRQFENSQEYYCTYFHELIHSTGHSSRLSRSGITEAIKFASKSYGEEELIAEMGASFLSAYCDIDIKEVTENSTAYIDGWLKKIKSDKKLIFKAAADAQKAVNHILGGE